METGRPDAKPVSVNISIRSPKPETRKTKPETFNPKH